MSDIVLEWAMLKVVDHSNRVWKNENFRAGTVASTPVNVRAFLSHQIFHMWQWGIIFQIDAASSLPNLPAQQANKSSTPLGITQQIPNNVKTISQRSRVIGQCNRRWLTDSPPDLHMQHQSKMSTFLFLRLSMVRILPSAAVQVKKETLVGTLTFQMLFQGNISYHWNLLFPHRKRERQTYQLVSTS